MFGTNVSCVRARTPNKTLEEVSERLSDPAHRGTIGEKVPVCGFELSCAYKGERPEDYDRSIDSCVDPAWNAPIRDVRYVILGILELDENDHPGRGHRKPSEDVRHHPTDIIVEALFFHELV